MTLRPSWIYHQTDQVERTFVLPTHSKALDFIVGAVEIVEEAELELGLWLQGSHVRISVVISPGGAPRFRTNELRAFTFHQATGTLQAIYRFQIATHYR